MINQSKVASNFPNFFCNVSICSAGINFNCSLSLSSTSLYPFIKLSWPKKNKPIMNAIKIEIDNIIYFASLAYYNLSSSKAVLYI